MKLQIVDYSMPKLFLGTLLILTLFVSACVASAQTDTPAQNYVRKTTHISDYYQPPSNDQDNEFIVGDSQCAEMEAKAVKNHNAYHWAMETLFNSTQEVSYSYDVDIIGEYSFVKYAYCHQDLKNPDQFVVILGLDSNKERIEEEKKTGRFTRRQTTYTFFDEEGNIVRWGR